MSELSIVVGVSSVLGLSGLAMYLYYQLQRRRLEHEAADSIAEDLEGPAKMRANDILKVIMSFRDEAHRLEAIKAFTGYDERKARILVRAAVEKPPVVRLRQSTARSENRMKLSASAFVVFLLVGVGAHLGERSMLTPSTPERQTLEFSSGPQNSGPGKQFSGQYELCSQGIPRGYRIESDTFRLTGDRACNAWSTCAKTVNLPDRVCWGFSLQGHEEIAANNGVKQSTGVLTIVIVKP